ncbi:MAG: TauD/TfdA family dioxygenase [Enterobacteriaceae bacterium]
MIYTPAAKRGVISENLIMAFSALVGEPYSIVFESPDIVSNLIPVSELAEQYTGLGSQVELDFHTEHAAAKFIDGVNFVPQGLLLSGVRHDPQGPLTRVADIRLALQRLDAETIACLYKPLFRLKVPHRWRNNTEIETKSVAVLEGPFDFPDVTLVYYSDLMTGQTDEAVTALKTLYKAIQDISFHVDIKPGELVYIDNRFALHSRDKFISGYDANGTPLRWIQRVVVAANLWPHRNLKQVHARVFQRS